MISIVLKDNSNKLIQEMTQLRDEIELLICDNIIKINNTGTHQLQIETYTDGIIEYWEQRGFIKDNYLYDKLIIEYNQQSENPLVRWK